MDRRKSIRRRSQLAIPTWSSEQNHTIPMEVFLAQGREQLGTDAMTVNLIVRGPSHHNCSCSFQRTRGAEPPNSGLWGLARKFWSRLQSCTVV